MSDPTVSDRYLAPSWFTENVFNRLVARFTKMGISVWGARVLLVRGRTSGEIRANVVNVLTHDGERYLVAPRGTTQWVRNIRAAGEADLKVGRRVEAVAAEELDDEAKPAVLRAYLRRWKWEVGQFFDGVGPDSSEDELLRIASGYPVFRLHA
jgi:deazaflavin-dependent oxidoreductase (nitroreductase family)